MIQVYGIKNCDSVKKALTFLKKHDLSYELFDFKTQTLPCEKISFWLTHTEMSKIFNTRSTTYRNLKLKELMLDNVQKEIWLCKENLLIKRPILEYDNSILIGFNESQYIKELL